jgi:hypothetical protein
MPNLLSLIASLRVVKHPAQWFTSEKKVSSYLTKTSFLFVKETLLEVPFFDRKNIKV